MYIYYFQYDFHFFGNRSVVSVNGSLFLLFYIFLYVSNELSFYIIVSKQNNVTTPGEKDSISLYLHPYKS